ncbi:hypothetical protein JL722_3689 [Aureococcus anophagefferens]|nr:hypothetical protein JL722_3689 [Aureococcus anophagefferens]
MRITKKLSAPRTASSASRSAASSARGTAWPSSARARFLASLDGGAPAAARRERAAPADDGAWLASFRGDAWLDDGGALEPAGGAWRAAAAPRGPRASAAGAGGARRCRVVARDDGLLGELSDVFARRGLNVVRCRCEAAPGGGCRDEFEVAAAGGGARGLRDELGALRPRPAPTRRARRRSAWRRRTGRASSRPSPRASTR